MKRLSLITLVLALTSSLGCTEGDETIDELHDEPVTETTSALGVAQWSSDEMVPGALTRDAPTLAGYQGKAHMVHTGVDSDRLYHQTFDGTSWSAPAEIPGQRSMNRPGLAAHGSKAESLLHMVHQGHEGDNKEYLWWSTYDGHAWSKNVRLEPYSILPPVLVTHGGKLYLFGTSMIVIGSGLHREAFEALYQLTYDGSTWSGQTWFDTLVDGFAVAAHAGQLVLVTRYDNHLFMSTSSGDGVWTPPTQIVGQKSKSAPALASFGGVLHMTHLGDTSDKIWWSTWDGSTWTANQAIPGQESRWAPSLAVASGELFQAHIAGSANQTAPYSLWYSTFQ